MRPEPKKRLNTNAALRPTPGLNAAFAGLSLPDLAPERASEQRPAEQRPPEHPLAPPPEPAAPGPRWKMGRVVLRREKAHRGGKTVIVIDDFATHLPLSLLEAVAKKVRIACGCGGTLKVRAIEIQGDQAPKIRQLLEAEGFQVAGVK